MSDSSPLCAWCGMSTMLKRRTLVEFGDLPQKPVAIWHSPECVKADPLFPYGDDGPESNEAIMDAIAEIHKRAPSRIVWWGGKPTDKEWVKRRVTD